MKNMVYVNSYYSNEDFAFFVSNFDTENDKAIVFQELTARSRAKWNEFIDALKEEDTAILYSFDSTFRNYNDMMFFIKYCTVMSIRLISYADRLDTKDKLFPESGTKNTFDVVCRIFKKRDKTASYDVEADLHNLSQTKQRLKRYSLIINMYKAGWSIQEIMKKVGYSAKSNIYNVLKKYNIELRQPKKSRKKKRDNTDEG